MNESSASSALASEPPLRQTSAHRVVRSWRSRYRPRTVYAVVIGGAWLYALLWLGGAVACGLLTTPAQVNHATGWLLFTLSLATFVALWIVHGWLAPIDALRHAEDRPDPGLRRAVHRTVYRAPRRLFALLGGISLTVTGVALLGTLGADLPVSPVGVGLSGLVALAAFALVYLMALVYVLPHFDAPLAEVGLSDRDPALRLRDLLLATLILLPSMLIAVLFVFAIVQSDRLVEATLTAGAVPHDTQGNALVRAATIVIVYMALTLVIGHRLMRMLSGPLEAVSDAARAIARGDLRQEPVLVSSRDELGRMGGDVNAALDSLRELVAFTNAVASGNLRLRLPEDGEMASAFNRLVATQQDLVRRLTETSVQINSAAAEIFATSRESESNASDQASSVEETKRTMNSLLESSSRIAESAHAVFENAEKTTENIRLIADRLAELVAHNQKIGEILDIVRDIADRSDLLALNASLEGTRAGEAGRGFNLVADEMRRLAESVMDSVSNIKQLVADVRASSQGSVLATEEGVKLGIKTTESARLISFITQQQQSGTEQVSRSMDEISQLLNSSVAGARQATTSADELRRLSETLQGMIRRFQLQADDASA